MQHLLSSKYPSLCMYFSVQFISTQNVWLQQIGTDFTQTGSTTPSIIISIVQFIGYNIANTVLYQYYTLIDPILMSKLMSELITQNFTEPFIC